MKKIISLLLALSVVLSFAGCAKKAEPSESSGTKTEEKQTGNTEKDASSGKTDRDLKIDVDLTKLSKTMVYSEVLNMMQTPKKYIGKVVKMKGTCSVLDDAINQKTYYSCIIQDATACCAQGIEFELDGEDAEYPENYSEICVIGEFDTYTEGEYEYCTLRHAQLVS